MAASIAKLVKPLDWASGAVDVVRDTVPTAYAKSGFSQVVEKNSLRPGDHIYAWRLGHTYQHHGVVVQCQACASDECEHETLRCCAVVHFRPPEDGDRGRIEVVSLHTFASGRKVSKVRYGVRDVEFYLRRSGSASTDRSDPWPLVTFRALGLLQPTCPDPAGVAAAELPGGSEGTTSPRSEAALDGAEEVVYDLLSKNSELLARWCELGAMSGICHFRSGEHARSLQTSNGRFLRLGLGVAAATAAGTAAVVAAGGLAAGATGGAVATEAVTEGAAAAAAAAAVRTAGKSAVMALMSDAVRHPKRAVEVFKKAIKLPGSRLSRSASLDEEATLRREEDETIVSAMEGCIAHLGVRPSKSLALALESPGFCCRLSSLLVDILEAEKCSSQQACAAAVQTFFDAMGSTGLEEAVQSAEATIEAEGLPGLPAP